MKQIGSSPRLVHLATLAGYLLLSLLLTWPTVLDLGGQVFTSAGGRFAYPGHDDIVQNVWNLWWVREALTQGINPFQTPLLYHPDGVQMYVQTLNLTSALLTMPVQLLAGPIAAYNTGVLLAFTLTGYAAFLLARAHLTDGLAAWAAGALVTAAPFHMMKLEVNHFNLMNMQWLALAMVALVYLERRGSLWTILAVAVSLALVALTDWYWALVAGLWAASWAVACIAAGPGRLARLGRYILASGLTGLLLAPLLWAIWRLRAGLTPPTAISGARWEDWIAGYSADAFGLLFPSLRQPLWTGVAETLTGALLRDVPLVEGWYVAAGWTLMALAAVGVWRHGRRHWQFLVAAGVCWLLSLGPELRVLGVNTGLPLPYALLADLPLVSLARRPNLFAVPCIVVAGLFAALALADIGARLGRHRPLLYAGLAVLAALELLPPVRYGVALDAPALYRAIAERPGPVIDMPVGADIEARTLLHQMAHGQPILRGYVARPPDYPALRNPLLAALARGEPLPNEDILPLDGPALMNMQCYYGFRHLVIEKPLTPPEQIVAGQDALVRLAGRDVAPWHEDGQFLAYELPQPGGPCVSFAYLGAGWGQVERDGERIWRWLGASGEIYLVNPGEEPVPAVLELTAEGYDPMAAARPVAVQLHLGQEPAGAFSIARSARRYSLPLMLAPGTNRLRIEAEARPDANGRALSISVSELRVR